jgi:hypothetical protein
MQAVESPSKSKLIDQHGNNRQRDSSDYKKMKYPLFPEDQQIHGYQPYG